MYIGDNSMLKLRMYQKNRAFKVIVTLLVSIIIYNNSFELKLLFIADFNNIQTIR